MPSLRDDFLQPPPVTPGSQGILSVHYQDRVYRIPVDGNIGKKVPVGDSGLTVEIVEYYPNAVLKKDQFASQGTEPKNPMLQLRVHPPDGKPPVAEIAYAYRPFVNYAGDQEAAVPGQVLVPPSGRPARRRRRVPADAGREAVLPSRGRRGLRTARRSPAGRADHRFAGSPDLPAPPHSPRPAGRNLHADRGGSR